MSIKKVRSLPLYNPRAAGVDSSVRSQSEDPEAAGENRVEGWLGVGRILDFVESGLLENEPAAPAEQAHTARRQ